MRVGFNYREGPVLAPGSAFAVIGDARRDVAYRMSFAEMVVPYRDPGPTTTGAPRTTSASGAWAT